jgi:D-serine deaminase-like pyridoxal phosphate-dependent protein
VIERLNEEHGVIDLSRCSHKPQVGERLQILPNHVCVVSNLHDEIAVSRGGVLIDTRRVEARGKTR